MGQSEKEGGAYIASSCFFVPRCPLGTNDTKWDAIYAPPSGVSSSALVRPLWGRRALWAYIVVPLRAALLPLAGRNIKRERRVTAISCPRGARRGGIYCRRGGQYIARHNVGALLFGAKHQPSLLRSPSVAPKGPLWAYIEKEGAKRTKLSCEAHYITYYVVGFLVTLRAKGPSLSLGTPFGHI